MSDARTVAAQGICNSSSAGVLFPWETLNDREREAWAVMADGGIAALRLAGYAVVELPKPTGVNGQDNRVWNDGYTTHYVEQEFNGDVIINDRQHVAADELAHLGAVLLAADAEAQS